MSTVPLQCLQSAWMRAYNVVFFVIPGYPPLFLGLGLAVGILAVGHRLAHRIGAGQAVGVALLGLLGCLVLLATSTSTTEAVVVLIASGLCMGPANANLTDLALGAALPDRRRCAARGHPGRYLGSAHVMAAGCGERVRWSRGEVLSRR